MVFSTPWGYLSREPQLIETVEGGINHILQSCLEAGIKTVIITSSTGKTTTVGPNSQFGLTVLHCSLFS